MSRGARLGRSAGIAAVRFLGRRAVRGARRAARRRTRGWVRELRRPWREGRSGAAAEVGRWVGFGLATGAMAAGIAAALYAEWPRD